MSKHYVIGKDSLKENLNKARKERRARYLQEKVIPVLNFLDDHGIDHKTVNSYSEIVEHFKKDFPFPNAPDARNFELMGIETAPLRDANKLREFNKDFYIDGNEVKIKPEWLKANEEDATYYTHTESEVKAYHFANEFIEMVRKGYENGFISKDALRGISENNYLAYFNMETIRYEVGGIRQAGERHDKIAVIS